MIHQSEFLFESQLFMKYAMCNLLFNPYENMQNVSLNGALLNIKKYQLSVFQSANKIRMR